MFRSSGPSHFFCPCRSGAYVVNKIILCVFFFSRQFFAAFHPIACHPAYEPLKLYTVSSLSIML